MSPVLDPRRSRQTADRPAPMAAVPVYRARALTSGQEWEIAQQDDKLIEIHRIYVAMANSNTFNSFYLNASGFNVLQVSSLNQLLLIADDYVTLGSFIRVRFQFETPIVLDGGDFIGDEVRFGVGTTETPILVAGSGWIVDKDQLINLP